MGFDFHIGILLHMDPVTGRPYTFDLKELNGKLFELPSPSIPEKLRPYLYIRGPQMKVYTEHFNEKNQYTVCVDQFLEHFPSWKDVKEYIDEHGYSLCIDESDWTQQDHYNLKCLLDIMVKVYGATVDWSY